jgi:hypothetical protein
MAAYFWPTEILDGLLQSRTRADAIRFKTEVFEWLQNSGCSEIDDLNKIIADKDDEIKKLEKDVDNAYGH